ncbi:MAG: hypothetical protein J3Q66DRAFT_400867 [Benniella sp.]|nr:MAG: hypothetical protein J3Q66DRAFT_400867 [Benniella sp.]
MYGITVYILPTMKDYHYRGYIKCVRIDHSGEKYNGMAETSFHTTVDLLMGSFDEDVGRVPAPSGFKRLRNTLSKTSVGVLELHLGMAMGRLANSAHRAFTDLPQFRSGYTYFMARFPQEFSTGMIPWRLWWNVKVELRLVTGGNGPRFNAFVAVNSWNRPNAPVEL